MKSNNNIAIGILLALFLVVSSCEDFMVGEFPEDTPEENFQLLWEKYDRHYGLFQVKGINWDSLYKVYHPKVSLNSTDEELFQVMTSMLSHFDDLHVSLYTTSKELADYNSSFKGPIPANEDFLMGVVTDNYLSDHHRLAEDVEYGKLTGNIGYIYLGSFKESTKKFENYVDKMINELYDTKGIVIDIRNHAGGSDAISKYIAGRFASSKKLFMISKKRNGPAHDDFEDELYWYIEPEGKKQYLKPVVLITDSHTASAGETFTFAMRENDNVILLGDTTAGGFTDEVFYELLNGWIYSVGVGDYRGSDGKSYEGIGVSPDIYSLSEKSDLLNGVDRTLEKAIELLNQ